MAKVAGTGGAGFIGSHVAEKLSEKGLVKTKKGGKMKTILVTGAAGFVGSHLCGKLLAEGNRVVGADNFCTGSKKNIEPFFANKNFSFLEHDITSKIEIKEKINELYNLASPASPKQYLKMPVETLLAGSVGVKNVLELALKNKARFLQASTSEVYGNPLEHPQKETYFGNVNPVGPRSCFSSDTDILTRGGWKLFQEIILLDEILTLNKNGEIEYKKPIEIIKERYAGELFAFKNTKVDLLVTPNHKMLVRKRGHKEFGLVSAFEYLNWSKAEMLKKGKWKGIEEKFFYLPWVANAKTEIVEKIKMDDWLEFFGYFISEGCVYIRNKRDFVNGKEYTSKSYNVLIAQKKGTTNWWKIKSCLSRLPFKFFDSDDHQFRISNKQLATYLSNFGKSHEKFIPVEIKNLSVSQLNILLNALILGDGSKNGKTYYTNSFKLAGDIQEILLKVGKAGLLNLRDRRKKKPVYTVYILTDEKKDFLTSKYPTPKIEKYDGWVYCVNVPNHIIFVRRNGKALFCGNCYDESKRFAEALAMAFNRAQGLETRIVRIFNTYGPRMQKDDGRVISNFIVQALENKPITIYGSGKQTRSFCFVSDLVNGMIKTMSVNYNLPINLGNPEEHSIAEIAEKIRKISNSSSKMVFRKLPEDDPERRKPDISTAKKLFGWQPKVPLETGLRETIAWFRQKQ